MKRLHVHVSVEDLSQSIRFYSTLFASEPSVLKDDYAKWMLDDPRVNFAISTRPGNPTGVSHLGIQAETETELAEVCRTDLHNRANLRSPALSASVVDPVPLKTELVEKTVDNLAIVRTRSGRAERPDTAPQFCGQIFVVQMPR